MDDYSAMLRAQEELIENGRMEAEFKNAHRYPLSMKSGHKIMLDTGLAFIMNIMMNSGTSLTGIMPSCLQHIHMIALISIMIGTQWIQMNPTRLHQMR